MHRICPVQPLGIEGISCWLARKVGEKIIVFGVEMRGMVKALLFRFVAIGGLALPWICLLLKIVPD